jgi:archaeal flagellin FlaB
MDRTEIHSGCEEGFTGLEAAIVLIAFIVVAAVFSYVILGAGFFTSQTAQATVQTGIGVASSSIEPVGDVYGIKDSSGNYLAYSNVTIALTAGGTPIDLSSVVVSYNDNKGGHNSDVAKNAGGIFDCSQAKMGSGAGTGIQEWCIAQKINYVTGTGTSGTILDDNAQAIIMVGLPVTATPGATIVINFQPVGGATLPVKRTVPASITAVQVLY